MLNKTEKAEKVSLVEAVKGINAAGMTTTSLTILSLMIDIKLNGVETSPTHNAAAGLLDDLVNAGTLSAIKLIDDDAAEDTCEDPDCESCVLDRKVKGQDASVVYSTKVTDRYRVPAETMAVIRENIKCPAHVENGSIAGGVGASEDKLTFEFKFLVIQGTTYLDIKGGSISECPIANLVVEDGIIY